MQENRQQQEPQNIFLEDGERATVSGVLEVVSFDEQAVVVETTRGRLTISGGELHVETLTLETGELVVTGQVISLLYSAGRREGGSFWSRFF